MKETKYPSLREFLYEGDEDFVSLAAVSASGSESVYSDASGMTAEANLVLRGCGPSECHLNFCYNAAYNELAVNNRLEAHAKNMAIIATLRRALDLFEANTIRAFDAVVGFPLGTKPEEPEILVAKKEV